MERRIAVVTGGGSGIGRGIVEALTRDGIDCLIAGRRLKPLQETAEALSSAAGTVHIMTGDVTQVADRATIIRFANERFGRVDILVNNAGGGNASRLLDQPVEAWREVMAVNLEAAFFLSQGVMEGMRSRRFGRIVNISSILGIIGNDATGSDQDFEVNHPRGPYSAASYCAAKGGLTAMTRDLAVSVATWGITVNTVSPGYIERPDRSRTPHALAKIASKVPIGRHGDPVDIGNAVAYLVSEGAGYVTGADLVVDGGRTAW
jgi:NAD(P)-dependent dehydrogenase (short-subunit alcohol dehydrogenase family)